MGNLIKYEFRKTWIIKAIILVFTAIFELLFLAGTFSKNEDMQATGIIKKRPAYISFRATILWGNMNN